MTVSDYSETSFALYLNEITLDPIEALRLGETRHKEAQNAQGILGITPEQVTFFFNNFNIKWGQCKKQVPYIVPSVSINIFIFIIVFRLSN